MKAKGKSSHHQKAIACLEKAAHYHEKAKKHIAKSKNEEKEENPRKISRRVKYLMKSKKQKNPK